MDGNAVVPFIGYVIVALMTMRFAAADLIRRFGEPVGAEWVVYVFLSAVMGFVWWPAYWAVKVVASLILWKPHIARSLLVHEPCSSTSPAEPGRRASWNPCALARLSLNANSGLTRAIQSASIPSNPLYKEDHDPHRHHHRRA